MTYSPSEKVSFQFEIRLVIQYSWVLSQQVTLIDTCTVVYRCFSENSVPFSCTAKVWLVNISMFFDVRYANGLTTT